VLSTTLRIQAGIGGHEIQTALSHIERVNGLESMREKIFVSR
jgi:hypothetical protein